MENKFATTAAAASVDSVHSRRCPPQDPIRPARYLNGVKLDDHEVVNIAQPLTKDQTDFDWLAGILRGTSLASQDMRTKICTTVLLVSQGIEAFQG